MALLLPHGMSYNSDAVCDRYAEILPNLAGIDVYAATPPAERGQAAIDAVRSLLKMLHERTGLPLTLSQAGVSAGQIPEIASVALDEAALSMNVKQPTYEELVAILEGAL